MTFDFSPWEWVIAVIAALLVGFSKTGVGGLGMLFVVMFARIMPAKQATGVVLPLLCFGDMIAAASYRKHAKWSHVWRLLPWTAAGVIIGWLAMDHLSERQARYLIGAIVLALVAVHLFRRWQGGGHETEHGAWFPPTIGVLAGFTTLVANAAGPLMAVYMLAMRLPKMEYVGTAAVFFFIMNLFKVPFMVELGLINQGSFMLNLTLAPAVFVGTILGRKLLPVINQRVFENLALTMAVIAAIDLVFKFSSLLVIKSHS